MPFGMAFDPNTGRSPCDCCNDRLWHCKKCWDKFHNGEKHNDYEPPKFFGQSLMDKEVREKMAKEHGIIYEKFKEHPEREYKEGEYH